MRPRLERRVAFPCAVVLVAISSSPVVLAGQRVDDHWKQSPQISWTVSVASLRIPEKARRHYDKAIAAAERNHSEEVENEALKAIAIAPNFADAYLLRARQQVRNHNYEAAIASAEAAQRAEPGVIGATFVLAGAYNGLQRYRDARHALEAALGPEVETWQVKYEQARASIGLNDVEAALYWSALALAADRQNFADIHLVRSNALLLARRWSEAAVQMELYLQSEQPQAHRTEVLAILERTKQRIRDEGTASVAAR